MKKALYGLKQAPRAWYGHADSNLYYKVVEGDTLILVLYVDDLFLTGDDRLAFLVQETTIRVRDGSRIALLSRSGDMAEAGCDTGESGEVHG